MNASQNYLANLQIGQTVTVETWNVVTNKVTTKQCKVTGADYGFNGTANPIYKIGGSLFYSTNGESVKNNGNNKVQTRVILN